MTQTYQLFFGRSCPDGRNVSIEEWMEFKRHTIDRTFDGYTIHSAVGAWKGSSEIVKIMTVCTDDREAVLSIADEYKKRFNQESVGLITLPAMEFL
jgi:hypothetical protein